MERITLAKMHEQIDTLKSTSLPQMKRFLRKRIRRALVEAKLHANNVKKTIESVTNSSSSSSHPDMRRHIQSRKQQAQQQSASQQQQQQHPVLYDHFGWGSDFDDDDDTDDDESVDEPNTTLSLSGGQYCHDSQTNVAQQSCKSLSTSLSVLSLHETQPTDKAESIASERKNHSLGAHSLSLQCLPMKSRASQRSSASISSSSTLSSTKRPNTEPPPPPLPKEPPPPSSTAMDKLTLYLPIRNGPNQTYETVTFNENDNDEYLLPITAQNGNYEYVPYTTGAASVMAPSSIHKSSRNGAGSSGWESLSSNSSSSFNRFEMDTFNERPLPPIPDDDDVEALLLKSFSWFHSIEREEAEQLLKKMSVDGVYLVRPSKRAGASSPYTLTLFYSSRIFHLNIRRRICDGQFALGMEKPREKTFRSVAELIEHHNSEPIFLTSKGRPAGKTRLLYTPS